MESAEEASIYKEFCTVIGMTLLELQRTEFLVQAIISHVDKDILLKDKRFKNLTPESFLSNSDEGKKSRKQTLGVLIEFLNNELSFFSEEELEKFLLNRNKFIHNLWHEEIGEKKSTSGWTLEALKFVIAFAQEVTKWQSIFRGLSQLILINLADRHGRRNDTKHIEEQLAPFVIDFLQAASLKDEKGQSK